MSRFRQPQGDRVADSGSAIAEGLTAKVDAMLDSLDGTGSEQRAVSMLTELGYELTAPDTPASGRSGTTPDLGFTVPEGPEPL